MAIMALGMVVPSVPDSVTIPTYLVAIGVPFAGMIATAFGGRSAGVDRPWRLGAGVFAVLAVWGASVAWLSQAGLVLGGVDTVSAIAMPLTWLVPMVGILWALRRATRVRAALGSSNGMARLASTQVFRTLGLVFLVLHARGSLPSLFTYPATWGDVATGVTAPFAAWAIWYRAREVARPGSGWRRFVIGWNVFGFCEHLVAVVLGTTLFPGPLQLFHGSETTAVFASVPMVLFPAYLVCFADTLHLFLLDVLLGRPSGARTQPTGVQTAAAAVAR